MSSFLRYTWILSFFHPQLPEDEEDGTFQVQSDDMEKDLKELKAEFEEGKIQAYPNFESEEPLYSPQIGLY